jgi:hypothetical protein
VLYIETCFWGVVDDMAQPEAGARWQITVLKSMRRWWLDSLWIFAFCLLVMSMRNEFGGQMILLLSLLWHASSRECLATVPSCQITVPTPIGFNAWI